MSSKFEIETLKIFLTNYMVIIKGMYWNAYGIRLLLSYKIYFVIACWRPAVRSGNVSINTKVITVNQMINKRCQSYSGAKKQNNEYWNWGQTFLLYSLRSTQCGKIDPTTRSTVSVSSIFWLQWKKLKLFNVSRSFTSF